MFLKAAINGGRSATEHPAVPRTIDQIVAAGRAAIAAGADVVHAHIYTEAGAQTIHPDRIGAWVRAVRIADPTTIIGTTTGLWTVTSHEERMAQVAGWPADALPDFASVAFSEEGAAEAAELVLARGMALESAVWSETDVPALLASPTLQHNIRILIEPQTDDPREAVRQCRAIARRLAEAGVTSPMLYHGYDATVWAVVQAAVEDRKQTRIGFEDGILLPNGEVAATNDELVRAVRGLQHA